MTTRYSEDEARACLGDLLDSIARHGAAITIERDGQPAAVLISPHQFEIYQRFSREEFGRLMRAVQEANRDLTPEEAEQLVAEEVAAARRERRERRERDERADNTAPRVV